MCELPFQGLQRLKLLILFECSLANTFTVPQDNEHKTAVTVKNLLLS